MQNPTMAFLMKTGSIEPFYKCLSLKKNTMNFKHLSMWIMTIAMMNSALSMSENTAAYSISDGPQPAGVHCANGIPFTSQEKIQIPDPTGSIPKVKKPWSQGEVSFTGSFLINKQPVQLTIERSVVKTDEGWTVTEMTTSSLGGGSEEMHYDQNYRPLRRIIRQMGQTFTFTFGDDKVSMNMMGYDVDIDMNYPYLADGPGLDLLLASFQLKPGDTFTVDWPDLNTMKPGKVIITAEGMEERHAKKCVRVSLVSTANKDEKTTYWIDQESDTVIETIQIVPSMMNAEKTVTRK